MCRDTRRAEGRRLAECQGWFHSPLVFTGRWTDGYTQSRPCVCVCVSLYCAWLNACLCLGSPDWSLMEQNPKFLTPWSGLGLGRNWLFEGTTHPNTKRHLKGFGLSYLFTVCILAFGESPEGIQKIAF